jgi:A/G-specific adenine glycosylase
VPTRLSRAIEPRPRRRGRVRVDPELLAQRLLGWYRVHARRLPWRGRRDPYAIWVSEVMLQQTQVATVRPYYARFLEAFPTVDDLARAPLDRVLGLWSGLGYYSRARSMHAAASAIAALGAFPDRMEALRALPGFGPYTAAAVASIAFDLPEPAIDGNAARVYARLLGLRLPRAEAEIRIREAVRPILEAGPPSALNQAVMDLGATLCTPREPDCPRCPWGDVCRARALGLQEKIPLRSPKRPPTPLTWVAAVVPNREGELLFARRPEHGLFAGLWELPGGEVPEASSPRQQATALGRRLRERLGLRTVVGRRLGRVSQRLTHRHLEVVAFETRAARGARPRFGGGSEGYLEARFVSRTDATQLGLSSVTRKLLEAVGPVLLPSNFPSGSP